MFPRVSVSPGCINKPTRVGDDRAILRPLTTCVTHSEIYFLGSKLQAILQLTRQIKSTLLSIYVNCLQRLCNILKPKKFSSSDICSFSRRFTSNILHVNVFKIYNYLKNILFERQFKKLSFSSMQTRMPKHIYTG